MRLLQGAAHRHLHRPDAARQPGRGVLYHRTASIENRAGAQRCDGGGASSATAYSTHSKATPHGRRVQQCVRTESSWAAHAPWIDGMRDVTAAKVPRDNVGDHLPARRPICPLSRRHSHKIAHALLSFSYILLSALEFWW